MERAEPAALHLYQGALASRQTVLGVCTVCAPTCSSSVQAGDAAHWKPSTFTAAASTPPRTDGTLHRRWGGQQAAQAWQQRRWTVQPAPPVQMLGCVKLPLATPCPHPPGAARKVGKEAGVLPVCQSWQDECPAGEGASGERQPWSVLPMGSWARHTGAQPCYQQSMQAAVCEGQPQTAK